MIAQICSESPPMIASSLRALAVSCSLATLVLFPARPALAEDLARALLLPELFEIMAAEGRSSVLGDESTPLQGSLLARFEQDVARIYTPVQMAQNFVAALEDALQRHPDMRADTLGFAQSDLGKRVLQLEVSARAALLDDAVDEAARLALETARDAEPGSVEATRLELVRERIAANDLIELNVSLGLNTSFAYYRGMLTEDAVGGLSADALLQLVWAQEPEIRADIEDWIESYFLMAYQPLSDAEFRELIDYAQTPLAVGFNQIMFQAFDTVFSDISRALGQALGRRMQTEEL